MQLPIGFECTLREKLQNKINSSFEQTLLPDGNTLSSYASKRIMFFILWLPFHCCDQMCTLLCCTSFILTTRFNLWFIDKSQLFFKKKWTFSYLYGSHTQKLTFSVNFTFFNVNKNKWIISIVGKYLA